VKLLEKHARDPQIILIWSLDFLKNFENYLRLVWIKHKKEKINLARKLVGCLN
jgi:hypothetical protein